MEIHSFEVVNNWDGSPHIKYIIHSDIVEASRIIWNAFPVKAGWRSIRYLDSKPIVEGMRF